MNTELDALQAEAGELKRLQAENMRGLHPNYKRLAPRHPRPRLQRRIVKVQTQ